MSEFLSVSPVELKNLTVSPGPEKIFPGPNMVRFVTVTLPQDQESIAALIRGVNYSWNNDHRPCLRIGDIPAVIRDIELGGEPRTMRVHLAIPEKSFHKIVASFC